MGFDPTIAAIRFGEGLAPDTAQPQSLDEILSQLDGPDQAASEYQIVPYDGLSARLVKIMDLRRVYTKDKTAENRDAFRKALRGFNDTRQDDFSKMLLRSLMTTAPFLERLTRFWADHFTVIGKRGFTRYLSAAYVEDAIRPNISGRFADMLKAAVLHPMMLDYLDQTASIGPNAPGNKRGRRGLNENLAREVMELHSLGVDGPYGQSDVRQLAELFTGLSVDRDGSFLFRPELAEPGVERILGKDFGGATASLADIEQALETLALHPATAQHLARKLVVHFCSDTPDSAHVDHIAQHYLKSGGDLRQSYLALLEHPAAWTSFGEKVKQPIDFVISALRALAVRPRVIEQLSRNKLRSYVVAPMTAMGQQWYAPGGPDGWPEDAGHWITPHGLAARLQWSISVPSAIYRSLPDPRAFVETALGSVADEQVMRVAQRSESRREGVGLVLASAAFQRR